MSKNKCKFKIYSGLRIGRLILKTKAKYIKNSSDYSYYGWYCDCDCGTKNHFVFDSSFRRKNPTLSCGCYQRECISKRSKTHGERYSNLGKSTPEYYAWSRMLSRCRNPDHADYFRYGGRGISVCSVWEDNYEKFLEDVGRRPSDKHSLERIDNNGNYVKGNVKWATKKEQARNRRSNRKIEIEGETKLVVEWSEISGVKYNVILIRLNLGWEPKRAVFQKIREKQKQC